MRWTLVVVVAVTLMTSAGNAFGSTVSVEIEFGVGLLEYNAAPGEVNDVQVSRTGDTFTIIDEGAVITAGSGCVQISDHVVSCSSADRASFFLDDMGDTAELLQGKTIVRQGKSIELFGEEGGDHLSVCALCSASLVGGTGNDVLEGGDIRCDCQGGGGDDTITGGAQGDFIRAGGGDDTISTGGGQDLIFPHNGDDLVNAGTGRDELFLWTARGAVLVDLRRGTVLGYGSKTLIGVEDVVGTDYADELYGNDGSNALSGLGQGDVLVGRGGADLLVAGDSPGDDRLFGGRGPDRLLDWMGSDLLVGNRGDDRLRGGAGHDRMYGRGGADRLRARDGERDLVAGGRGRDVAYVDPSLDVVRSVQTLF